jgi:hypothetical protein
MALPPSPAPAPMAPGGGDPANTPMGADSGEPAGGGWEVCCTILRNPETGTFKLVSGDEPETGDPGAAEGQEFADGPSLLRAVMTEIEGGSEKAAEDAFGEGMRGEGGPPKAPAMADEPMV